jgi:hypothetical protein
VLERQKKLKYTHSIKKSKKEKRINFETYRNLNRNLDSSTIKQEKRKIIDYKKEIMVFKGIYLKLRE